MKLINLFIFFFINLTFASNSSSDHYYSKVQQKATSSLRKNRREKSIPQRPSCRKYTKYRSKTTKDKTRDKTGLINSNNVKKGPKLLFNQLNTKKSPATALFHKLENKKPMEEPNIFNLNFAKDDLKMQHSCFDDPILASEDDAKNNNSNFVIENTFIDTNTVPNTFHNDDVYIQLDIANDGPNKKDYCLLVFSIVVCIGLTCAFFIQKFI